MRKLLGRKLVKVGVAVATTAAWLGTLAFVVGCPDSDGTIAASVGLLCVVALVVAAAVREPS